MKFVRLGLVVATAALFGCATESSQTANSSANAQPAARTASSAAPAPAPHSARDITIGSGSGSGSLRTAPMMRSVYYAYDQADVTPESRKVIEANAEYL